VDEELTESLAGVNEVAVLGVGVGGKGEGGTRALEARRLSEGQVPGLSFKLHR